MIAISNFDSFMSSYCNWQLDQQQEGATGETDIYFASCYTVHV